MISIKIFIISVIVAFIIGGIAGIVTMCCLITSGNAGKREGNK